MSENLYFEPGYYKIIKLYGPNVIEVEDTVGWRRQGAWYVKLKGVGDSSDEKELHKWLKEGQIVRVVPYSRNPDARVVSDVWLGNAHINRQFPGYEASQGEKKRA